MVQQARGRGLSPWRRFRRKAREVRPLYLLQILLQRAIPRDLLRVRSLLITATDLRALAPAGDPDPEIRWATPDDVAGLAALRRQPEEGVRARFESGARAVVATRDGRVVGVLWCRLNYVEMDDWLRFTLPPRTVGGIGTGVAAELRGQRIYGRMKRRLTTDYARAGCTHLLGWVEALNRNSIRAIETTGGRFIGRVLTVRCLGLSVVYFNKSLRVGRWSARRVLELPVDPLLRQPAPGAEKRREGAPAR